MVMRGEAQRLAREWRPVDDVWAALRPLSARALQLAQQTDERTTHRAVMRFRADVASGWRLRMGYRYFAVQTVHDPDERRRYIECLCEEEGR